MHTCFVFTFTRAFTPTFTILSLPCVVAAGYAGPLDPAWRQGQLELGQQIVGRMRDLGMTTVLPGFAGHVPPAMKQLYPKANITQSPTWAGFNSTYSEW
jgi:hypothetical protein